MPADWVGYWDPVRGTFAERWLLNLSSTLGLGYKVVLCHSRRVQVLPEDDKSGLQKIGIASRVDPDLLQSVLSNDLPINRPTSE